MTRIVDGLCDMGLASRESHEANGRITMVVATEAGTDLMHQAANRRVDAIAAAISALSPGQQKQLNDAAPLLVELAALIRSRQEREVLGDRED